MTDGKYVSEEELNAKAVAPRVTLESLEAQIIDERYFSARDGVMGDQFIRSKTELPNEGAGVPESLSLVTYCVLTLKNGFAVTGQSACASPENYDEEIGRRVARGDAIRQCWALLGYALRDKLHAIAEVSAGDDRLGEALTHLTAFGLGNKDALNIRHVDAILSHFTMTDRQEEGGRTFAREMLQNGVNLADTPAEVSELGAEGEVR